MGLLIDTDTASDDAVAILMALKLSKVDAITVVAGNLKLDQEVENALYTLELSSPPYCVPVYPGCERPLLKGWKTAEYVHGLDGMGNSFFPKAKQRPEGRHAVDALIELLGTRREVVALGPLTNLAVALAKMPDLSKRMELYMMFGTLYSRGNVTPVAEFNAWVDPDSAKLVLSSGVKPVMVPWEVCIESSLITDEERKEIEEAGTREARFFLSVTRASMEHDKRTLGIGGSLHPDALTMAIALDEGVAERVEERHVEVFTGDGYFRGAVSVDHDGVSGLEPNARVVYKASRERFRDLLFEALGV